MPASLRLAVLVLAATTFVPTALAQTTTSGSGSDLAGPRTVDSGHALTDEQAAMEEQEPARPADDGLTTLPDETNHDYFAFGFLARGTVVPDFMINAFVVYHGGNPVNAGMGGYFSWRRNGLNFTAEVWYLGFGGNGYYHGNGAADTETEFVQSNLGAVFGNVVFQWAVPIAPWFSIDIGLGLGLGGMTGNLYRQEAYRDASQPYGYAPCAGVGMAQPGANASAAAAAGSYCEGPVERPNASTGRLDDSRMHGGTYQISTDGRPGTGTGPNPFYFGDGGVPPMMAWLDLPRITARFTPIRWLQIRLDLSYNIYGFTFGGGIGAQFP